NYDIVQFRGQPAPFLAPSGRASFNLFKMLHPDLLQSVRHVMEKAKTHKTRVIRCNKVLYKAAGEVRYVNIQAVSLPSLALKQQYFLIVFEEYLPLTTPTPKVLASREAAASEES